LILVLGKLSFTIFIILRQVCKDEPCKVVNEKGDNKIILGGYGKPITADEICSELSKI